ncbi:hypothetical protein HK107_11595 [Parvularcula sp. ZS-1/3]|uniref:Uncharacterized protein n=1 Tax=Parvularcula mediterranea TaxID=2732508 RepID=A0A7Y3RMS8_9PROT|nr:hypothetical protein [Parvularcula mediterranea]NNU16963.1 hypothetical protein [Parvularcula mediterranea]
MRLRRVAQHAAQKDWVSLGLEFLIVVTGVFLGVQLGNLNAARSDRVAYEAALDQLAEEIDANREIVAGYRATYAPRIEDIEVALGVLESCSAQPGDPAKVNTALQALRSTPGYYPRLSALVDLTENDIFKRLQSPEERQAIQELRRILERVDEGSSFLEEIPFRTPIEEHPMVVYGSIEPAETDPGLRRLIELDVPLEQACKDTTLLKKLYQYERLAAFTQVLADLADDALDTAEATLDL